VNHNPGRLHHGATGRGDSGKRMIASVQLNLAAALRWENERKAPWWHGGSKLGAPASTKGQEDSSGVRFI